MRLRTFAVGAALLATAVAGGAMVSAQAIDDERVDRSQLVGGWLVEFVSESDGGYVVRMSRDGDDFRLRYHEAFWRGNYGPIRGVSTERRDCGGGGEESGENADPTLEAGDLRRRFVEQLAQCGAGVAEVAAALRDLEPAFEVASGWAAEAAAMTAAENAAIAAYGEENVAMDMNMAWNENMAIEVNSMDESHWTNSVEPQSKRR
jgi:hypothetical protein